MATFSASKSFYFMSLLSLGLVMMKYSVLSHVGQTSFNVCTYAVMKVGSFISAPVVRMQRMIARMRAVDALTDQMVQENAELKEKLIALQGTQDFNQETKDLIEFSQRYAEYEKKLGHIIHTQLTPEQHYMLLDIGQRQGVATDMVAVYKNCLLGKVIEVFPYHCKVLLITDRKCSISVYCTQTKTEGIHEGINEPGASALKHISHLEKLEDKDLLISSGKGLVFPRGFGVGRISSFALENVQYNVHVSPLIDITTLKYCYVMRKGEQSDQKVL